MTKREKIEGQMLHRLMTMEARADETDDRTIEISVSSEAPVERWFGNEILVHDERSVDLSFFGGGTAPLLMDHDARDQIGVVQQAWMDAGTRRLRAKVRFSKASRAQEVLEDIRDGIRANVSVGYVINKTEEDKKSEDVRVTDWSPKEVSIVSIPADETVGVGRAKVPEQQNVNEKEPEMADDVKNPGEGQETRAQSTVTVETKDGPREITFSQRQLDDRVALRSREVGEIYGLAAIHNMRDKADEFVREGKSLAEFTGYVRSNIPEDKPLRNDAIGLTNKEVRNFSLLRLARAHRPGASASDLDAAKFEIEAIAAAEEMDSSGTKSHPKGMRMPREIHQNWIVPGSTMYDQVMAKRELSLRVLQSSLDTDLVPTEHRAGSFIDVLRNASAVMQAGPTMLQGLSGDVDIPGKATASTATWVSAEHGDATVSEPTFRTVALTPKDIAVYTDMSRRMRQQSSPDVENIVRMDIAMAIALGLDLAALEGSGTLGQPTGVLNTAGLTKVAKFVGVNPTFPEVVTLETAVADDNALMGNLAYIGRTNMYGALKTTTKDSGSGQFVVEPDGGVNGYRYIRSNQGTDGNLYFGNWSDVMIGMWGTLDLQMDYAALALKGGLRMIAFQTVDVAVRHIESFAYGNDTL